MLLDWQLFETYHKFFNVWEVALWQPGTHGMDAGKLAPGV
jgi:hypothetical protein